jgi:hypothetical protein
LQTKLEFSEEVKEEERTAAPESEESMVFIKMEEEDVEEKNVIETSIDVDCREKDPLSR